MKRSSFALFLVAAVFILVPAAHAQQSPPPTCTLSASAGVVQKGGTVNLRWQSTNAVSGTITSIGSVGPSGIQGVIPTQTTEYVGVFAGAGGTARCSVTVIVTLPSGGTTVPTGSTPSTQTQSGQGQTTEVSTSPNTFPTAPGLSGSEAALTSQTGGLVPCIGTDCQACHLASLVQNIIKFLIMLAIPLAALLFAVAGAMYFTTEVTNQKERAKAIIKKGIIGFIIALSAFLVVNTIFYILFDPQQFPGSTWTTIQCTDNRQVTGGSIQNVLNRVLGRQQPAAPVPGGSPPSTISGGTEIYCDEEGSCYQDGQPYTPPTTSPGSQTTPYSHQDAYATMSSNGICVSWSGSTACQSNPDRTSLQGLQPTTIFGVTELKSACNCDIRVTAGTEGGHAAGTYSHGNGYKLDLGFNTQLDSYITTVGQRQSTRSDGAALYRIGNGLYARETTHWDVVWLPQ
jgi:hypothetical protein